MRLNRRAERAGVSISTVSHVVNQTRPVAAETRERVLGVMRELNYYKNAFGRRLARGRSDALGLLISDIENPFFPELIKSFESAVVNEGLDVFLCATNYDPQRAATAVRRMIENKVQGVAVMTSQLDAALVDELLANDIPVVLLDHGSVSRGRSNVRVDYSRGAGEAVNYLRDLGHRGIGLITGPLSRVSARAYRDVLLQAMRSCGLKPGICVEGDNTVEGGRLSMQSLLQARERPTAVLCGNDLSALGAIRAVAESGLRVPQDISIVGADDISFARYATPPLTTIQSRLMIRESTAAPRPERPPKLATA
ncbi:MAG: LacI family DNA-binding transcriptional regulator [Candidatus Solibacter sp.]|nr:LacI family DNA-binding transcriptional regulator [Candidatus Solibacter sp.]